MAGNPEWVAGLLGAAAEQLAAALAGGQRLQARLLLRLLACLAATGTLQASCLVAVLQALLDAALDVASQSKCKHAMCLSSCQHV